METVQSATIIDRDHAPVFELHGLRVTGGASPSRGARETSVWKLALAPGTPAVAHAVTREEIFVCVSGRAELKLGGETRPIGPGDTLIIPADTQFSLGNPYADVFEAVVAFPIGGMAVTAEGTFTPPWAT
jgi:quercetin dioxygenase-like cupin family protein